MQKLNKSVLHCFHDECPTVPTVVLEFESRTSRKKFGQIITCPSHESKSMSTGLGRYKRADVNRQLYPSWLRRLHQEVINHGTYEGCLIDRVDIEKIQTLLLRKNPQERK